MSKKAIKASFYTKNPLPTDAISIMGWSGNHWDNIAYFPKNYQIACVRLGRGEIIEGDTNTPIGAGQFFLIHPNKIHSGKPDPATGWTVDAIVLKSNFVSELFDDNPPQFNQTVVTDAALKTRFDTVFDLLNHFENNLENEGQLYLLIADLFKNVATTTNDTPYKKQHEATERAVDFITKNYKQHFSLDELAETAFLSKFHLLRTFKAKTGLTPYMYQTQLRLNEARKLIFKDISLTEIAYELGFADQAHFTNTFKKHANGANPSDLLKTAISFNFQE